MPLKFSCCFIRKPLPSGAGGIESYKQALKSTNLIRVNDDLSLLLESIEQEVQGVKHLETSLIELKDVTDLKSYLITWYINYRES